MPESDFAKLPRPVFFEVADLLPMRSLLDMRQVSLETKNLVADYLKSRAEQGRITDTRPPYKPIDSSLSDSRIVELFQNDLAMRAELPDIVKAYDKVVRDGLEDDDNVWEMIYGEPFDVTFVKDQTKAITGLKDELKMRASLHAFVKDCLGRKALVDRTRREPVSGLTLDDALAAWAKGALVYDKDAPPHS